MGNREWFAECRKTKKLKLKNKMGGIGGWNWGGKKVKTERVAGNGGGRVVENMVYVTP